MGTASLIGLAVGTVLLVGCGTEAPAAAPTSSGVTGLVHLGPQCPVEREDKPCDDDPAANVTVTVSLQIPGDAYVSGDWLPASHASRRWVRIAVTPGDYVVTAEAGMSCELMDATSQAKATRTSTSPAIPAFADRSHRRFSAAALEACARQPWATRSVDARRPEASGPVC